MYRATLDWIINCTSALQPPCARPACAVRRLWLWVGLVWCLGVLSLPAGTHAQVSDPGVNLPATEARKPARFEIGAGFEGRGETDIEDGGEVEETRIPVRLGLTFPLSDAWRLGLRVSYLYSDFDFSGNRGIGGLDPWEEVHMITVALPLTYRISASWQLLFAPILAVGMESGADIEDSTTGGGAAGFIYTASPRLSLGLALGALSQIEDDASFLILPIIRWQIMEHLTLATEMDVSRGYGGTLAYRLGSSWQLKGGLSFKRNRFRLDTADAIGETSGAPLWASVIFAPSQHFSAEVYGGFVAGGNIRIEDEDGDKITDKDLDDPQPLLGLIVKAAF